MPDSKSDTPGYLAVWDLAASLKSESSSTQSHAPVFYHSVHAAAVRCIATIQTPPIDANGTVLFDSEPQQIITGSSDGTYRQTDLRDPGLTVVRAIERCEC